MLETKTIRGRLNTRDFEFMLVHTDQPAAFDVSAMSYDVHTGFKGEVIPTAWGLVAHVTDRWVVAVDAHAGHIVHVHVRTETPLDLMDALAAEVLGSAAFDEWLHAPTGGEAGDPPMLAALKGAA